MMNAHYKESSTALDIFLYFIWTFFFFFWLLMNSHSLLSLSFSHSHYLLWGDLNDLFTSQMKSHGEIWITSVSLGQLAGHTWIHPDPCLSFTSLFYLGMTKIYLDEVLQKINRPWLLTTHVFIPVRFLYFNHLVLQTYQKVFFQATLFQDQCVGGRNGPWTPSQCIRWNIAFKNNTLHKALIKQNTHLHSLI